MLLFVADKASRGTQMEQHPGDHDDGGTPEKYVHTCCLNIVIYVYQ